MELLSKDDTGACKRSCHFRRGLFLAVSIYSLIIFSWMLCLYPLEWIIQLVGQLCRQRGKVLSRLTPSIELRS